MLGKFQALPPLDERQRQAVVERLAGSLQARRRELADAVVARGTAPDPSPDEIRAQLSVRRVEAAMRHVQAGEAWAFPAAGRLAGRVCRELPRAWIDFEIANATTAADGSSIDVVIAMDPSADRMLGAAEREAAEAGQRVR